MLDASRKDLTAGVAGSGTMGRGIVQVLAQAGVRVLVYDAKPGAGQAAKDAIAKSLAGLVQKGRVQQADADATLARIEIVDGLAAFAPCHLVVEAVLEQLEIKRELWQALEKVVTQTCILASNTSSLSVTAMAAGCAKPGRVVGYHFFNPVPVMKVVEVVDGVLTEPWVGDALMQLAKRFGHTPVRCNDTPGFIVNHAGRGFVPESLRVLSEGIADFAAIDRILVDAAGFRLGPFGLMDLVGLDVGHAVMKSMYEQYFDEPKYKPFQVAETRVAAGLLGRKTGRGWYTYKDGAMIAQPEPAAPASRPDSVWVAPDAGALKDLAARLGAKIDAGAKPAPASLCLVAPIGRDATTTALALGLDPARTVAVDPLYGFTKRRTLMCNPLTSAAMRDAAHGLLASDGVPVSVIKDSPGFVAQRVVAHIVNVGCDIVQQRVASPEDLDRAVMLGLGYPKGPLGMGDAIGAAKVLAVLDAMHDFYQEPRYRASPWLKRRAQLGVSLLTRSNPMLDAYLYDGLRSPIGRHAGKLAPVRPDDLAAEVISALMKKGPFKPEQVEDVIFGCVTQSGEDCRNVARFAALLSGLPHTTPGATVNRLCASGLQATVDAARAITCGEGDLYIAGGVESMTRAPYVLAKSETAYGREVKMYDTTIGARFSNPRFTKQFGNHSMPETGDNVAKEFGVSREQADEFAAASQRKYAKAKVNGFFEGEIHPIALPSRKKDAPPVMVTEDEHPRPDSTLETLAKLKPLFEGGVVTAGNASGVNDGAAALFVGSRKVGEKAGAKPIAKVLSAAASAVEPRIMGVGPAYAIRKAAERAGITLKDLDIIEINEAFASQVLGCLKLMDVDFKDERVNPNGGAIAIGHPLGCSGARLAITVARELQRRKGRYAAVSLCIGVGQGLAVILERVQ